MIKNKKEWLDAVEAIEYRNWHYQVLGTLDFEYLQITFIDPDTGEVQHCRKWHLHNGMTASDVVKTAFMATLAAEEHEARERFKYKKKRIFGPHFDVDRLVEITKLENLDIEKEPVNV